MAQKQPTWVLLVLVLFVVVGLALLTILIFNSAPRDHEHIMVTSEAQFIREMIPHHQEAVNTATEVINSENPGVRTLATKIIIAQSDEINMMRDWMNEWYANDTTKPTYENMMPDLTKLEGHEQDDAFLEGMIEHHRHAVIMAQQLIGLDAHEEVKKFAQQVIEVQSSEIAEMQELLEHHAAEDSAASSEEHHTDK